MPVESIKILLISDLHCYVDYGITDEESEEDRYAGYDDKVASYLVFPRRRVPPFDHPLTSLLELRKEKEWRADMLVMAGDLANKTCLGGIQVGHYYLKEIQEAFSAPHLIAAIGNHDVDSRHIAAADRYGVLNTAHESYPPLTDENKRGLLHDGFVLIEYNEHLDVIVLNSAIEHHDKATAMRGTFPETAITKLDALLSNRDDKHLIAVLHHHPMLHSMPGAVADYTVIPTGERLCGVLSNHKCSLILHGHRHFPKISTTIPSGKPMTVMCAGSMSVNLGTLATATRNVLHLLEISIPEETDRPLYGEVYTWEWQLGYGFVEATSSSFPHRSGFGASTDVGTIKDALVMLSTETEGKELWAREDILRVAPEVVYLSPDHCAILERSLFDEHELEIRLRDERITMGKLV